MAVTSATKIFDIEINRFYNVIVDYPSYPEFIDGVSKVRVIKSTKTVAEVEYCLNLIKEFTYKLKLNHRRPNSVSWGLLSSDLFQSNNGSWKLEDLGNSKTRVTYSLEVEFRGFVPNIIVNKLVSNNLPRMMEAHYKRARAGR